MELRLARCVLRPWRPGDEPALLRHANSRAVWRNLRDGFPHPYTAAHAEAWIGYNQTATELRNLAIEVDGEAAGGVGCQRGEDVHRFTAQLGYWLGEACWGRGIMTEAVRGFAAWAFGVLELERLYAAVFHWNRPSMRVLEKAGFTREGVRRHGAWKDGEWADEIVYARLRTDPSPGP